MQTQPQPTPQEPPKLDDAEIRLLEDRRELILHYFATTLFMDRKVADQLTEELAEIGNQIGWI